ncbi:hypothetical protein GCM10027517_28910 [Phycicoccus ginsengisoli]
MRKLTIVVPCTDRKSLRPQPQHLLRDLPCVSLAERHDIWRQRIDAAVDKRPLETLYAGETWAQCRTLVGAARQAGFDPSLFVASAGLGLRPSDFEAPAYGATFAMNAPDSVGRSGAEAQMWWSAFGVRAGLRLADVAESSTLIVLSESYARAMEPDLVALGEHSGDYLLVGGHRDIAGLKRMPADLGLRAALGGTASSLNARMARAWLEGLDGPELTSVNRKRTWAEWSANVRRLERYDRSRMSDAQVTAYVRDLRRRNPDISQTVALRNLRDAGQACEQKRFRALFNSAVTP